MPLVKIKSYASIFYAPVWEVTERKDGEIYKTRETGLVITQADAEKLKGNQRWITSSFSTKLTKNPEFEINVVPVAHFLEHK